MGGLRNVLIAAAVLAALAIALTAKLLLALQHRAVYPGGLTFVGSADGLLGSRYHRVYLWRAPHGWTPFRRSRYTWRSGRCPWRPSRPNCSGRARPARGGGAHDRRGPCCSTGSRTRRLTWLSIDAGVLPAGQRPAGA